MLKEEAGDGQIVHIQSDLNKFINSFVGLQIQSNSESACALLQSIYQNCLTEGKKVLANSVLEFTTKNARLVDISTMARYALASLPSHNQQVLQFVFINYINTNI